MSPPPSPSRRPPRSSTRPSPAASIEPGLGDVSPVEEPIQADTRGDLPAGATMDGGDEELAVRSGTSTKEDVDEVAEAMWLKFSPRRKTAIVSIVAYSAVLSPFAASSFLPSIPAIVVDLNTTATVLNATVAIFFVVVGIFPLFWSSLSGVYGRKPIYVISLPICTLGSLGVALSPNLVALIFSRIVQGAGSCAVLSVGAGTIGDLYRKEERGTAMGVFYSMILVGPALAPAVAGVLTEYAKPLGSGWRAMQWLLFAMGVVASLLCIFFLPETSHSRGMDRIREAKRVAREKAGGLAVVEGENGWWSRWTKDWVVVRLNPLSPLKLLVHPHILALSINSSFVLMSTYTTLVPLGETLAPRYNITNAAIFGCFYLAQGMGYIIAAQFTGRYSDYTLAYWLKRRGHYVPEDRLRAVFWGGGLILPGSVLAIGWVMERVEGAAGLTLAVLLLLTNGIGLMVVLTPCNTYCVDVMQHHSAEVTAAVNFVRYAFTAGASAFALPMIQRIGVGWTNTFAAVLCWIGFAMVLLCIRFGERMRGVGRRWAGEKEVGRESEVTLAEEGGREEKV